MSIDLNVPEVQDAIKEAVNEAIAGLKNKNTELLSELKKARKNSEIDPDDYNRLKEENDVLSEKLSESQKLIKQSASEIDKYKKAHEGEQNYVSKLLIDNGLTESLLSAGVKPELSKAVKAMFASQASIKIDGDNRQAIIGDKALSDYVKEWAGSDEGKHFVSAPLNQGSGGQGGSHQGGTAKQLTREQFDSKSPSEKVEFSRSGGKITD